MWKGKWWRISKSFTNWKHLIQGILEPSSHFLCKVEMPGQELQPGISRCCLWRCFLPAQPHTLFGAHRTTLAGKGQQDRTWASWEANEPHFHRHCTGCPQHGWRHEHQMTITKPCPKVETTFKERWDNRSKAQENLERFLSPNLILLGISWMGCSSFSRLRGLHSWKKRASCTWDGAGKEPCKQLSAAQDNTQCAQRSFGVRLGHRALGGLVLHTQLCQWHKAGLQLELPSRNLPLRPHPSRASTAEAGMTLMWLYNFWTED